MAAPAAEAVRESCETQLALVDVEAFCAFGAGEVGASVGAVRDVLDEGGFFLEAFAVEIRCWRGLERG